MSNKFSVKEFPPKKRNQSTDFSFLNFRFLIKSVNLL